MLTAAHVCVQDPVHAEPEQVDSEETSIQGVGRRACPLQLALERIVATPGGTVIACWQIVDGTDVTDIRAWLKQVLPNASRQQVVTNPNILHTTLARLVAAPRVDGQGEGADAAAATLQAAVDAMTEELCGLRTTIDKLW